MESRKKSMGALLSEALDAMTALVRGEIALARAEVEEKARLAARGVLMLAVALILGLVALGLLADAAVAVLVEQGLSASAAALIVAVVLLVVAGILALLGRRWLSPSNLMPRRTAENLRQDARNLREALTDDRPQ